MLEAVSNRRIPSPIHPPSPPLDADTLFFRGLAEDFKTLSYRTRQALKFEMHRLVFEVEQREDAWDESSGLHMTVL